MDLLVYISWLKKLKTNKSVLGEAPHKPVLLLAIISLIKRGEIYSNRIEITPELVLEFKNVWNKLVITKHVSNFALPFFHMKSEPFWRLVTFSGKFIPITNSKSIQSLAALKESIAFAELDKKLFEYILNPVSCLELETILLSQYFPESKDIFFDTQNVLYSKIESEILDKDRESYRSELDSLKNSLGSEAYEEEVYIRSAVFKREIPKIYNYQCAISGMRVESSTNAQLVDACHIVPFAISKDDTITNGISLSPNLHRAFDRGLLTINEEYIIRVSPAIKENNSPFSLRQFEGRSILLPTLPKHYPSIENLKWHRKECFVL
jgi:putative restriction endonuclease